VTDSKQRPALLHRHRGVIVCGVILGFIVYGLAHTDTAINFAWRQARGTRFQPHVMRWAMANGDASKRPVEVALARNRIAEGQSVDAVIAKHGPFHVMEYGPYKSLEPTHNANGGAFESYIIIAKDGKLRSADWWTCTGQLQFFNSLSQAEVDEYIELRDAHRQKIRDAKLAAQMALAGSVLHKSIFDIPRPNTEGEEERAEEP
jgi:hypothetical protein